MERVNLPINNTHIGLPVWVVTGQTEKKSEITEVSGKYFKTSCGCKFRIHDLEPIFSCKDSRVYLSEEQATKAIKLGMEYKPLKLYRIQHQEHRYGFWQMPEDDELGSCPVDNILPPDLYAEFDTLHEELLIPAHDKLIDRMGFDHERHAFLDADTMYHYVPYKFFRYLYNAGFRAYMVEAYGAILGQSQALIVPERCIYFDVTSVYYDSF